MEVNVRKLVLKDDIVDFVPTRRKARAYLRVEALSRARWSLVPGEQPDAPGLPVVMVYKSQQPGTGAGMASRSQRGPLFKSSTMSSTSQTFEDAVGRPKAIHSSEENP